MLHRKSLLPRLILALVVASLFLPLGTIPAMAQVTPEATPGSLATQAVDSDADLIPDENDNCVAIGNTAQFDQDADGAGDACDDTPTGPDLDQDDDLFEDIADNCPADSNTAQLDSDGDGAGDACDDTPHGADPIQDTDPVDSPAGNPSDPGNEETAPPRLTAHEGQFPVLTLLVLVTPNKAVVPYGEDISLTVTVKGIVTYVDEPDVFIEGPGLHIEAALPQFPGHSWRLGAHDDNCEMISVTLYCDDEAFYPPQTKDTFSVTITSPTTMQSCGDITLTVEAKSATQRIDGSGKGTVGCPQISISNQAIASEVAAGNEIGFTITGINTGMGPGSGIGWSVQLPPVPDQAWVVTEEDPSSPKCTLTTGTTLTCAGITIPPNGGSYAVRVTSPTSTAPASCQTYASTATLTAGGEGTASASTAVICAGVAIVVTPDEGSAKAGDTISFTLKVINFNPEPIDGAVRLTATLPSTAGLAWTLGSHAFSACGISGSLLDCSMSNLLGGESRSVTVTSPTTTGTCGPVNTLGTVFLDGAEVGSDSGSIAVACPKPTLDRDAMDPDIAVQEPIGFIITATNDSDLPMTGVTFSHDLPDGFDWTLAPGIEGCAITGGVLECTLERLAPGASIAIGFTAPTSAGAHCPGDHTVVTLGAPGSEDTATVTIHCEGQPPADHAQQDGDGVQVTQLPVTGSGPGAGPAGMAWLLVLASLMLVELGVIARHGRCLTSAAFCRKR